MVLTLALHQSPLLQVHLMATSMLQFQCQLVAETFQNQEDTLVAVRLLQFHQDYLAMPRAVAKDLNLSIFMQQALTSLQSSLKFLISKLYNL